MSKTSTNHLQSSINIFKQYKTLAEKAMEQVAYEHFFNQINDDSNSLYLIVKHLSGNMQSRWTDFLTTDGEKSWRIRDDEFEQNEKPSHDEIMQLWNKGWNCLLNTLEDLTEKNLANIVVIRNEPHSVLEAINRQIAHYSYHVGQIVFLSKQLQAKGWQTLSIAKGKSTDFNNHMMNTK